jgi:hypothetical protein
LAAALIGRLDERRAGSVGDCESLLYEVVYGVRGFPEMPAGGGQSEQLSGFRVL